MQILCYTYILHNRAENYPKLQYNFPRQCFSYAFSSAKALIINGVKTFFGSHCIFSFAISQDIFSIFKPKCKKIATEIAQNYAHHVLLRIPNPKIQIFTNFSPIRTYLVCFTHSIVWQIQLWCPLSKWNMGEILTFLA